MGKSGGRSVAQPGSASVWGTGGRGFKSRRSDQSLIVGPLGRLVSPTAIHVDSPRFDDRALKGTGGRLRVNLAERVGVTWPMIACFLTHCNVIRLIPF
jgi:hypothetical protein